MPRMVARYLFEGDDFAVAVHLKFSGHKGPGSDKTHITGEYIPKLRQFVDCCCSQQTSHDRDAFIMARRLLNLASPVRVGSHGPEFPALEEYPAFAHALLSVEHRATILQFDRGRD